MNLDLLMVNLLSPPILFFALGVLAARIGSDLEVPPAISRLFSLYLLWAIGFKGGVALREAGLDADAIMPLAAALVLSLLTTLVLAPILARLMAAADACAVAAAYGSVSVTTFVTAVNFLEARGIDFGGQMVAALALMEAPPIVAAIVIHRRLSRRDHGAGPVTASEAMAATRGDGDLWGVIRHACISGPVFLLVGSLVAGVLSGPAGYEPLKPFLEDVFKGVLVLFLLDAGLVAGARLDALRRAGRIAVIAGLVLPLAGAALGLLTAMLLSLSVGDAFLLVILAASASYIAVPAAMKDAIPDADPGLYLPMAIAVTFPFNVCLGIPLYLHAVESVIG
jgi:hypothetical protein